MSDSPCPVTLLTGDCLEVLRDYPDGYFSAAVTDPPYGLSREPDMVALLTSWLAGESYNHGSSGFMGQNWDAFVPGPNLWREVSRVMKPGAHLLCFASTRTWDLMSLAIRLAGFENRDTIASLGGPPGLCAMHGQGFPKGLDVSKALDKAAGAKRASLGARIFADGTRQRAMARAGIYSEQKGQAVDILPATPLAAKWSGWNVNLKPAWEIVLVFRKPISAPNVAANIAEHGTGGLNVDAARVATGDTGTQIPSEARADKTNWRFLTGGGVRGPGSPLGRYPPNLLLQHHSDCVRAGTKEVKGQQTRPRAGRELQARARYRMNGKGVKQGYADSSGLETVEDWECHEDCAVRLLGEQSGESGDAPHDRGERHGRLYDRGKGPSGPAGVRGHADSGTAARFFPQFSPDAADLTRFRYQAKPSKSERGHGCSSLFWRRDKSSPIGYAPIDEEEYARLGEEERRVKDETGKSVNLRARGNIHPTLKSRALLRWLVRLVCPPGGVILDPFAGTGTTGLSVMDEGFQAVLVEREPLYARIAQARLDAWTPQKDKAKLAVQKEPRRPRPHNQPEPQRRAGQIELFGEARLD